MHKHFSFNYNPDVFLNLFENNEVDSSNQGFIKTLYKLNESSDLLAFYKRFEFITLDRNSVELLEVVQTVNPHVNPRNNGLLVFPIKGVLEFSFYDYTDIEENLYPGVISPNSMLNNKIESTLSYKISADSPVAINGRITHSYKPLTDTALILVLKIPKRVNWETVVRNLND
jgi:hypothetical protein